MSKLRLRIAGSTFPDPSRLAEMPQLIEDSKGKLTFRLYPASLGTVVTVNSRHVLIPKPWSVLNLTSLVQVRHNFFDCPLCDLFFYIDGRKVADPVPEKVMLTAAASSNWSGGDALVSVAIADRKYRLKFPADATLAYCRTSLAVHYGMLWDAFGFAECDGLMAKRLREIPDIAAREFTVQCDQKNVEWTPGAGCALPPGSLPMFELASQICDVRKGIAHKLNVRPYEIRIMDWRSPPRPIDDEQPLAHCVVKDRITFGLETADPPRNRMYFREFDGSCRIIDADPEKTIGSLAQEFKKVKRPVYFELDGEVLEMGRKADLWVHPLNPISVFYTSPFLPVTIEHGEKAQTVFVEVEQEITVSGIGTRLGFSPGDCVFTFDSRPLEQQAKLFEQNPTGRQIFVNKRG
jgi:hypothetical protein